MTKDEKDRPAIPDPIKREVRQRCGFGCVFCGYPLYEYHHMTEYSKVQGHTEDNLTLLCGTHHSEATRGLLSEDEVRVKNSSPFNIQRGISSPYKLRYTGDSFNTVVGNLKFIGGMLQQDGSIIFIPISIDDTDIISFRIDVEGRIFLSLNFFDEHNKLLLSVCENELEFKSDLWDVEFVGRKITVRQGSRNIILVLQFSQPNKLHIIRGNILFNGIEILIRKTHAFFVNTANIFDDCSFTGQAIGIQIGKNQRRYTCCFPMGSPNRESTHRDKMRKAERKMLKFMKGK